jgi:hypothetical protein
MRSHYLTAVLFFTCSSFVLENTVTHSSTEGKELLIAKSPEKVLDFNVKRFSGEKVFISWHTEDDSPQIVYEVLRKHEMFSQFVSLGIVRPKSEDGPAAHYAFIDDNSYSDSSYYCLKKTNPDSVVFYSITKGVAGVGRNR